MTLLGENVLIERVYTNGRMDRLPGLAAELVRKGVDIIVTGDAGEDAPVAAARATQRIPILFVGSVVWPVEVGLVDSLAKPGRNVTGFTGHTSPEAIAKRLQFLRAIVPSAKRLSWLWGAPSTAQPTVSGVPFDPLPMLESAARTLGFDTRFHVLRAAEDVDAVFAEILSWRAEVMMAGGPTAHLARQQIGEFGLRHRLPIAAFSRAFLSSGALLSYGPSRAAGMSIFYGAIDYTDRILRGESPANLPVVRPDGYQLGINMKAAKALGLAIPAWLLQMADELVE